MALTDVAPIVTARMRHPDSHTLERYLATGGYDGLRRALRMEPEQRQGLFLNNARAVFGLACPGA